MTTFMTIHSLDKAERRLFIFSRCQHAGQQVGWTLLRGCSLGEIFSTSG